MPGTYAQCTAQVVDLLPLVRLGHKRSKMWLLKLLGQVTADKAVADAVADRQGLTRSSLKDFMVAWSLNRCESNKLAAVIYVGGIDPDLLAGRGTHCLLALAFWEGWEQVPVVIGNWGLQTALSLA